ncbi:AGE family epimerase/isomerase [Lichenihabitans sp. Uapishka_5]|uniref:AGE family epimerase/isomerase n=1 Tax=Lichenihabitans sp. Uapishka_5 TaxID=3037302 RepID=UPI0029E7FE74|nr:AGE family epimerase/isomerase [Lichenihabitans sp. Uapishka_5]MDX7952653.1 AGE family epimerase/isomerase [Lichenihabitans sp. Uapishka_5]
MLDDTKAPATAWRQQPYHRDWLLRQAGSLLTGFEAGFNPRGGFFDLDDAGQPVRNPDGDSVRGLHATTRMIYCYALGHLMGHPGASRMVDHGMRFLWERHRDTRHGGYFWQVDDAGPRDDAKQAYGHAFVLLAGAAAKQVGHPDADRLIADALDTLEQRFWEPAHGAVAEEFTADWQPLGAPYRGQNSNMHLTEALMAAYEATGNPRCLEMAESIADLLIRRITANNAWRLPEHFSADWTLDPDYAGSEMFRPAGTTPGHWLEWSRLLVQLWHAGQHRHAWMPEAAATMFRKAIQEGWDPEHGGFVYTLDWTGLPLNTDKIWWPLCEAVGAAAFLDGVTPDPFHEIWYRRIWDYLGAHVIDRDGRWMPQLDRANQAKTTLFTGRPDLYHALQACLIPLLPARGSLLAELSKPRPAVDQ